MRAPEGIPHVGQRPSSDRNARSQLPHASCDLRSASDLRHAASVSMSGAATSGSRLASTPAVVVPPECISAPGRHENKIRIPKTRSARSLQQGPGLPKMGRICNNNRKRGLLIKSPADRGEKAEPRRYALLTLIRHATPYSP